MGAKPVQFAGDHQQLAGRSESLDLSGSGVHERWCGQTVGGRSEALSERWQVVAATDAARSQHAECRRLLRRWRLSGTDAAASTRAARSLSEITHRVHAGRFWAIFHTINYHEQTYKYCIHHWRCVMTIHSKTLQFLRNWVTDRKWLTEILIVVTFQQLMMLVAFQFCSIVSCSVFAWIAWFCLDHSRFYTILRTNIFFRLITHTGIQRIFYLFYYLLIC